MASKIPSRIDKLDTIFSKTLSTRVFLKILENFSNFSKISHPYEYCCALFYIYVVVTPDPPLIYLKLKKFKGPKTDHFTFHFFHKVDSGEGSGTPPHPPTILGWSSGGGLEYLSRPRYRPPTPMVVCVCAGCSVFVAFFKGKYL